MYSKKILKSEEEKNNPKNTERQEKFKRKVSNHMANSKYDRVDKVQRSVIMLLKR